MYLNQKGFLARMSEYLYQRSGNIMALVLCAATFITAGGAESAFATNTGAGFYDGDTSTFIQKSVLTIKIVRFVAIFIVIAGIVWAGAEFAIKHDQQRGSTILVSAVIGGFAVLLAPTLINFVIGGLGLTGGEITDIK